jgi:hypothetical protein
MRLILAQTARTIASIVALYALLVLASYVVAPTDGSPDIIDTSQSDKTIFSTAPKYLSFARSRLASPEPKVLIVGASNADVGLRPDQMQPNIACARVNNLSIGNENATEMRQTVDLVHFAQDKQARLNNTFVFGVWYGDFGDSIDRWTPATRKDAETDIEVELYRYGFYRRSHDGPLAVLPAAWLPAEQILVRPFIVIESVVRRMTGRLRGYVFIRPPNKTDAEREAAHFSDQEKRDAALYWTNQLGRKDDVSGAQFAEFETMINRLLDAHEKVVLVDLPIPAWHQAATSYDPKYRERLSGLVQGLNGRNGFAFVDMLDLNKDEAYSDEVHPKPSLAKIWGERVSKTVDSIACGASQSSHIQAGK